MECTVHTSKGKTIRIPLEHGYRDEEAIRDAEEKEHRLYTLLQGHWEAVIDVDAEKVLSVMCRLGPYSGI